MRETAIEGGLKYFITGAVAASCFLMGIALVYGLTGSLDLRAITLSDPMMSVAVVLLLAGFLFKISAVPFHQWTPDAYEASPHPIAGFMSVATKGAAIIALMRVFPGTLLVPGALSVKVTTALGLIAGATLIVGNITALVQTNVKRMLAYSSISHAGYLLLGFVAGTPAALSAVLFYLVVYLAMNLGAFGLFTAYGLVGDRTTFEDLRGLGWKRPLLGVSAVVCFLSLAGIPPTGGFYGKFMIFKELIAMGHVKLAILGVLASLASVYYYLRVLVALFLSAPSTAAEREAAERPAAPAHLASATVWVCALIVMAGGFYQTFLMDGFAGRALSEGLARIR
jgi:NADH-quinone oxidoreductase subunit N